MRKQLKKLTLVTSAAFVLCLTIVNGTISTLPAISVELEEDVTFRPLADDEKTFDNGKTN